MVHQVLFANDSAAMILARMIGILGPIDEEMLALGQETSKYFTENYDLYHKNEVCMFFSILPSTYGMTLEIVENLYQIVPSFLILPFIIVVPMSCMVLSFTLLTQKSISTSS